MLATRQDETVRFDASSVASQHTMREKITPESTSVNKPVSNTVTTVGFPSPPVLGPKPEKVKGSSTNSLEDVRVADRALIKKVKRKPEHELEAIQFRPEKSTSLQGDERPKSQKQSASVPVKPTSLPGLQQSS